ncbi:FAD-dependent oxidoreductase, partial [Streptomyces globisporus]
MTVVADVIVVGGGVVGLTTAVTLAERGLRVRVWSRDPAGATTSAVAGALWWPYRIEPAERVGDWSLETLAVYEELAGAPEETGVRQVAGLHRWERFRHGRGHRADGGRRPGHRHPRGRRPHPRPGQSA